MEINRAKLSPMMQKYFETKDREEQGVWPQHLPRQR